jgi:hypothetical protein
MQLSALWCKNEKLNMGNITIPEVEQATHLGIIRTTTMKHNIQTDVDENITKARRSECEGFYMNLCFYW